MSNGERREARPLDGLKVLDFTQILAGPFCTQLLADAGAIVTKVEPPGGEWSGSRGSTRSVPGLGVVSTYRAAVNRGKRSIVLDLKNGEGLELGRRLAVEADVVVENLSPGALGRLGIELSALRAARPLLVTCSISLFGRTQDAQEEGLADRRALAVVAEAESSLLSMQDNPAEGPRGFGFSLGDVVTGMSAYAAIVTALFDRERTQAGQHVDIAMVRSLMPLNGVAIVDAQFNPGNDARWLPAGYGEFEGSDGSVAIGINTDNLFRRLATALDMEWMLNDERYALELDRDKRKDEVDALIGEWCRGRSTEEIVAALAGVGVPCGKVATPSDLVSGALYERIGLIESIADGLGGAVKVPANPFGIPQVGSAVPRLGTDTADVLGENLDIGPDEFDRLRQLGAFGAPDNS